MDTNSHEVCSVEAAVSAASNLIFAISDRINKMNKTALDNPNAPESTILRILCIRSKRIPSVLCDPLCP